MTDPLGERMEAIAKIPYLSMLPLPERRHLANVCSVRDLSEGARLFAEGDTPAGIFLILHGRIKLTRSSPDGREQILHEEGPGATLAEVPAFDGAGYVGTAVAVGNASVLFVPRQALLESLERNPGSALGVIAVLSARVRKFAALVEDLSLRQVTERMAGFLLREHYRTGALDLELPGTRDQLGAHVGTVREQVSRALSQLKREGVIDLDGRRVRITGLERLRELAGARL